MEETAQTNGVKGSSGGIDFAGGSVKSRSGSTRKPDILEEASLKRNDDFCEISNTKRIWEACNICHEQGEIGVIYGPAGSGKTVAVKEFKRRNTNVMLIQCIPSFTPCFLMSKLCDTLYLPTNLRLRTAFELVVEHLHDSGKLLLIDEAENLGRAGLDILRRVYDLSNNIGLVLLGLPVLLSNIRGNGGEFAQLYSRILLAVKLGSITESDAKQLVIHYLPSAAFLWPDFLKTSGGNVRRLVKLIRLSDHIAKVNKCDVDKQVIDRAMEMLIV